MREPVPCSRGGAGGLLQVHQLREAVLGHQEVPLRRGPLLQEGQGAWGVPVLRREVAAPVPRRDPPHRSSALLIPGRDLPLPGRDQLPGRARYPAVIGLPAVISCRAVQGIRP